MTCISNKTHKVNAVSVLWGRVVVFPSLQEFFPQRLMVSMIDPTLDMFFGVVNGVYDLKYYCMVI